MSEVSELTLKLIILLLPGAIAFLIYQKLTISYKKVDAFGFVLNAVIFSSIIYVVCELILDSIFGYKGFSNFWFTLKSKDIPFITVGIASIFSILIAYIGALIENKKLINRLAQKMQFADKYGDENLYTYFLNRKKNVEVFIHDFATNTTYNGTVWDYAETTEFKEIILQNVDVYPYDDPGKGIAYSLESIYIVKPKDNLLIEVPFTNNKKSENEKETKT